MRLFKIFAVAALVFSGTHLSAHDFGSEINLFNGYRNDKLVRTNTLKAAFPEVSQKDHIHINNIMVYQIGVDGRLMLPETCDCEWYSFFNNFYLSGFAYWGWGGPGSNLHEEITSHFTYDRQFGKARVKNYYTNDYQIGLGYLFNWCCWDLGILGGYAYDSQQIQTKHGKIAFPSSAPLIDAPIYGKGYKTTTRWQGPWVGTELFYNMDIWRWSLGYEYHFARYHATHKIPGTAIPQQQGMRSETKASNASGNVVYLNGRYFLCNGWETALLIKYEYWQANHGHLKSPYFYNNAYSSTKSFASGSWSSYSVNFGVGYSF